MPFEIALSGLNAASADLEVTGNNIANAATNGFKESRAEFASLYASSIQDTAVTSGQGVRVARIAQQFSQGSVDFTSNNLDLAISGEGFFVLESPEGTISYTRAGAYSVDRDGIVTNQKNDRLQVYPATTAPDGSVSFAAGVLENLVLPTTSNTPQATSNVAAQVNLDSSQAVITDPFDPLDPSTYNYQSHVTVYDSLGNSHTATNYYVKTAPNTWEGRTFIDGASVTAGGSASYPLVFDSSGNMTTPAGGVVALDLHTPTGGGADLDIDLDFTGTTQYAASSAVSRVSQNGFSSGRLAGLDIDDQGVVFARYTNGQSSALGKVALAKFSNNQGLRQLGDTNWAESYSSGPPQYGEAATSSFGQIQSGALESSNVDLAAQLVSLITAQRNFQANAEVISTADTINQTIINIR